MTSPQECPLELGYADPRPVGLDLAAIEREGVRIRRRRRVAGGSAVAAVALGAVVGVMALRPSPAAEPAAAGLDLTPIARFLAADPPVAAPVVIGTWLEHWSTVGWATADGRFCYAALRTPSDGTSPPSHCEDIDGDLNADGNTGATVGMPLPATALMEADAGFDHLAPFVGVVRGDVTRVVFTAYGKQFSAQPAYVATRGGSRIGLFQVVITIPGQEWGSSSFQSVVAYGPDGKVVARQGPWIPPTKPTTH
jgi:hypothetical protein